MYTQGMKVLVISFTRQVEGGEVVIGHVDTGVFLALPPDAVEILDILADGKTVGRTQEIYREKYGMIPEMEEFLGFLHAKGFVRPGRETVPAAGTPLGSGVVSNEPRQRRYHFANIPQSVAQALFGPTALKMIAVL